jgi:hypothetical protein
MKKAQGTIFDTELALLLKKYNVKFFVYALDSEVEAEGTYIAEVRPVTESLPIVLHLIHKAMEGVLDLCTQRQENVLTVVQPVKKP